MQVLANDSIVAEWLVQQKQAIVSPWIESVQRENPAPRRRPRMGQVEIAQLVIFFDGVVSALQSGDTSDLDVSIQTLVTNRLGQGYTLTDFLLIASELKSAIWQAAQSSLDTGRTVEILTAIEPVFVHSTAWLAWLARRAAEAQLEDELERTRHALAKLDRTKSDFISIAAHELKTPLTLIRGYTAILSSELPRDGNFEGLLKGLTNGIQRLQALIQDMIDVSLIDSNVLTLSLQSASLPEIIHLAVGDVKQEAANRHLTITIERFPLEVNRMYLDAGRMYQVFTNLIGNAIKYTPDNGTITVKARVLHDPEEGLRFAETTIADTGVGIAHSDLPYIFEKFYRIGETELHTTSKTEFKGGGPGLGLAIARGITEAHGGRIWAESPGYDEKNCPGSTFYIMLPLHTRLPKSPSERLLGLESKQTGETQ